MSLLPYLDSNGEIVDGAYIHILPFCKKHCSREKCKMHYEKLKGQNTGYYCCPYGLVSYVYSLPDSKVIFTGLKIRGFYDKKKATIADSPERIYNPIMDEDACNSIVREEAVTIAEKHTLESKLEAIRDLLHETRSLNGQIKNSIDLLWEANVDEDNIDYHTMVEILKNVHVSSFMVSNRFSYFDSILNPSLSLGSPYPAIIFRKFDKMRKLLKGYQRKNVWISINAPTQIDYKYSIYPTFETLLFIILENAIKYSPDNQPVEVFFEEKAPKLTVTIKSIGPFCDENEILHLCEKGFRGQHAKIAQASGQGFGLSFAKQICATHNIKIEFESVYLRKDHGVKYGIFYVKLHFDNSTTTEQSF